MFTSWDQVQSWIEDNNFARWIFYNKDPQDGREDKATDIVIDSKNFVVSDFQDKLAMTEKYIRMYGAKVWGVGFQSPETARGGVVCQVRLTDEQPQGAAGIGGGYPSIGELTASITDQVTKQVRAEMEAQRYRDERAAFEKEKKEFEEEKKSAMGAIVQYLAPVGQMILQKKLMRNVAGVDADGDVHVPAGNARIIPDIDPGEQDLVDMANDFTDEEQEKLYDLLARFKKVEPKYMELIEAVVTMAENGDSTYTMAKGFLIK